MTMHTTLPESRSASDDSLLYEHDEAILSAYLEGFGGGFKFGVQGCAAHLISPPRQISAAAARTNGTTLGRKLGSYRFHLVSGKEDG